MLILLGVLVAWTCGFSNWETFGQYFFKYFFLSLPPTVLPCMSFWNPIYEHIRPLDIAKYFLICENQFSIYFICFSSYLRWEYRFFPCYSITARSILPYLHFWKSIFLLELPRQLRKKWWCLGLFLELLVCFIGSHVTSFHQYYTYCTL